MKTPTTAIFLIVVFSALFIAGCATTVLSEKQTVRIGIILPLTGSFANIGEPARDAALLAFSQINNTKYNYELKLEDDALDTKMTSTAATKLINVDKVDALVSFTSGPGNVVSPIAQQNKILHVGVASDGNIANGSYNFLHFTPPEEETKVLIRELNARGLKKIAVFGHNQQGVIATVNALKKQIENTNISIVYEGVINPGDSDFRTMLMKAEESKPDIYLIQIFPPELEMFVRQLMELGINTTMTSIEAFEYPTQMSIFNGLWYVQAAEATDDFNEKYRAAYPNQTMSIGTANAYDAVNLIVAAYESAGSSSSEKPTTAEAAEALSKIKNFEGALGVLNVDDNGLIHSQASVRMIKDGKPVTIG